MLTVAFVAVWVEVADADVTPNALCSSSGNERKNRGDGAYSLFPAISGQEVCRRGLCPGLWEDVPVVQDREGAVWYVGVGAEEVALDGGGSGRHHCAVLSSSR